ncbi:MAG: aminopeptidase [Caldilineaceae bacterium]|nr:aminopeptidase [Caldilineaceae bacterium]MCB0145323.1 aminopeptidase [Caldilineaceae bacterium]
MNLLAEQQKLYAELLIRIGINLQPGQAMRLSAELAHRDFVRQVVEAAYQAGAKYVHVDWLDEQLNHSRYTYSTPEYLDFFPEYDVARHQQMVEEGWCRLSLVGPEFPDLMNDVEPTKIRRVGAARMKKLKFYAQAVMTNHLQWCVAAVPTAAWAQKIFAHLDESAAVAELWRVILQTCRADQADPISAWQQHDKRLNRVVDFMAQNQVRAIRYLDPTPAADGQPSTDLTVGLTDKPAWVAASSTTPAGVDFFPNIPTEEVFTTPHCMRTHGWVRTSKPGFPLGRTLENAYFRFDQGRVVEYRADAGQDVLEQFFEIPGTDRLGEASLVDVRSPVNQSGVIFHETLFDENAVCHIAFGSAYPDGVEGGSQLSNDELTALGVNESDAHLDLMIGTPTMNVRGLCADGSEVTIMHKGQFTDTVLQR